MDIRMNEWMHVDMIAWMYEWNECVNRTNEWMKCVNEHNEWKLTNEWMKVAKIKSQVNKGLNEC